MLISIGGATNGGVFGTFFNGAARNPAEKLGGVSAGPYWGYYFLSRR